LARLRLKFWREKMFSNDEKEYLKMVVERELEVFRKGEKSFACQASVAFLKAEHEYEHFLERLLEKLK